MSLTIWNCVLSYKENYFSENTLVLPICFHNRNFQVATFCYLHFNRWKMGFSGGKFATCYC